MTYFQDVMVVSKLIRNAKQFLVDVTYSTQENASFIDELGTVSKKVLSLFYIRVTAT